MFLMFILLGLINIFFGMEVIIEFCVNVVEFGDGYIQRFGDGLNFVYDEYNIVIEGLFFDEVEIVNMFFWDYKGYIYFFWMLLGEIVVCKWICNCWVKFFFFFIFVVIWVIFCEVFDL